MEQVEQPEREVQRHNPGTWSHPPSQRHCKPDSPAGPHPSNRPPTARCRMILQPHLNTKPPIRFRREMCSSRGTTHPNSILSEGRLNSSRNTAQAGQTAQRLKKSRLPVDRIIKLATNQRRITDFSGKNGPHSSKFGYSVETAQLFRAFQTLDG